MDNLKTLDKRLDELKDRLATVMRFVILTLCS